eukprot:TRINITY_DN24698_c0_g1_i2.p1 TRINITY_DN24698_c0_g1~~TRINITY_DN24698_c0_g1_i2.p1  ORF type:complete len:873 (-),score=158.25 TRINITY_DN24698_c0_g1_i2:43-2661(-)
MVVLGVNGVNVSLEPARGRRRPQEAHVASTSAPVFVPRRKTLELVFFRRIFDLLQKELVFDARLTSSTSSDPAEEARIPVPVFQRVIGRTFRIFGLKEIFVASTYDRSQRGDVGWDEFVDVWRNVDLEYEHSIWERVYMTLEDPQSCRVASVISKLMLLVILTSTLCFMLSTMPICRLESAPDPMRVGEWLEPLPHPIFDLLEACCIAIFTVEYGLRLMTCWATRLELLNQDHLLADICGDEPLLFTTPSRRLVLFFFARSNLVDFAAILPFYVELLLEDGPKGLVVLRALRLMRVFRVMRVAKYGEAMSVIVKALKASTKVLWVLVFSLSLGVMVFGSLMHSAEGGSWNPETRIYDRYVGRSWDGDRWQNLYAPTPFQSIPGTFWWCFITCLTVGYGDQSPTTSTGKVLGVIAASWGVIMMSLPIGVVANNFGMLWVEMAEEKAARLQRRREEMEVVEASVALVDQVAQRSCLRVDIYDFNGIEDDRPLGEAGVPHHDFLGFAVVTMRLPTDRPFKRREVVTLQRDFSKARRAVTGTLTLEYEWCPRPVISEDSSTPRSGCGFAETSTPATTPSTAPELPLPNGGGSSGACAAKALPLVGENASLSAKVAAALSKQDQAAELDGELTLRIVSAEKLLALDWKPDGVDAFCIVKLFNRSSLPCGELVPEFWRTRIAACGLSPTWGDERCFCFEPCSTGEQVFDPDSHGSLDHAAKFYARKGSLRGCSKGSMPSIASVVNSIGDDEAGSNAASGDSDDEVAQAAPQSAATRSETSVASAEEAQGTVCSETHALRREVAELRRKLEEMLAARTGVEVVPQAPSAAPPHMRRPSSESGDGSLSATPADVPMHPSRDGHALSVARGSECLPGRVGG